jgi:hypothetical protein
MKTHWLTTALSIKIAQIARFYAILQHFKQINITEMSEK